MSFAFALSLLLSFTEMRDAAGIHHRNSSGDPDKRYIVSSLGGGICMIDFDADGDLDLYFPNGRSLTSDLRAEAGPGNRLYRNEGGWRFTDVSDVTRTADQGWGIGCAVGDFDNDGFDDLYVTNIGPNVLLRNLGDGTFADVTERTGVGAPGFSTSAAWLDADGDADLDLYVASYVDPDLSRIPAPGADPTCVWLGMPVMCGPRGLDPQPDVYFRNDPGGFVDAGTDAGLVGDVLAFGLGAVALDYDRDGDTDLYVANDTDPNYLFQNDGTGSFADVGLLVGAAYNSAGATEAGMGLDFGDVDGDGHVDLFVTNFSHETNTLYMGSGDGVFSDESEERGLGTASLGWLGWGAAMVDFDNDGDEDLFVANGHVYPDVESADPSTAYRQANQVFENVDGRFAPAMALPEDASSRGAAVGDLDSDGDVDVVVVNVDERPSVLRNDSEGERHYLGVILVGTASNRNGLGARVSVTTSDGTQVKESTTSGSIFSANDARLHFGLGDQTVAAEVRVDWPSGIATVLKDVRVDRYMLIVEGRGDDRSSMN